MVLKPTSSVLLTIITKKDQKSLDDKYIAPFIYTKWLVISSLCWIGPSIYAYINHLYSYAFLLFVTSIISANYWRKATYSLRRNMDLIVSKIAFSVFVLNGIYYFKLPYYVITGYTGLVCIVYCYYMSNKLYIENNNNWYKYHIVFHILMTYEEVIIIYSIIHH